MTRNPYPQRTAIAAALLAFAFTLTQPILAAGNPKSATPSATDTQVRDSQAAKGKDRPDCKKIYQWVHRGAPGKGTDPYKLVRVECPTSRA
ncbi:MAG TPA: hypothetical protein VEZ88_07150 [Steroidobacteraceae bacterium]|nr:hypothetical protein [Steroidobacteraceae bacterium]